MHPTVLRPILQDCGCDAPLTYDRHRYRLPAKLVKNAADSKLVLLTVECTGAVDQQAARTQSVPQVGHDLPLTCGTFAHQSGAPLLHSLRVFAHHTLTGTWDIPYDEVEHLTHTSKLPGVAASDYDGGIAPFDNVLAQHGSTRRHILIGNNHRSLGQRVKHCRGLSSRCGTGVKNRYGTGIGTDN